jgi:hypothetical protein
MLRFLLRFFEHKSKTQKVDVARSAASTFWVLDCIFLVQISKFKQQQHNHLNFSTNLIPTIKKLSVIMRQTY